MSEKLNPMLSGVRVVDLAHMLAGGYGSMLLGDLGAEMIKIEPLEIGDRTRLLGPPFVEGEKGVLRPERWVAAHVGLEDFPEAERRFEQVEDRPFLPTPHASGQILAHRAEILAPTPEETGATVAR